MFFYHFKLEEQNTIDNLVFQNGKQLFLRNAYKREKTIVQLETKSNRVKTMISMKVYRQGKDILISACDEQLLGKKFIEGKLQIDASEQFYDGDRVDEKTLGNHLEEATIANLVGKEAVECAIKLGLIDKTGILRIKGVPHAQMIRMIV